MTTRALLLKCFCAGLVFCMPWIQNHAYALGEEQIVAFHFSGGAFPLAAEGKAAPILTDKDDWLGVQRAATSFGKDLAQVSGIQPEMLSSVSGQRPQAILVGSLDRSPLISKLVQEGKLDVSSIRGRWEAGLITAVDHPLPGIARALVVAGSDKRGTIFALYTLSEQIGVSPWAWWADVRVPHHDALYVLPGFHLQPSPAVRYRGIFLNDEAPALSGWVHEKYGSFNHNFYEHVFELILRLRANYLWPAMWGRAFNEDDPLNPKLADEYGVVMGTSHHEPLLRAQQEWKLHGKGPWDYASNTKELDAFWTEGIRRNREYESTITIGMRGDGDMPMGTSSDTALLEHIVADQRRIIAANQDPAHPRPQIWALYKEVQEYYEKGMRVPDDVTLLWSDDNWGNLRRLPTPEERLRPGGAGIYYHFDYVGDPRSYKWINVTSITKVWEQMNLALAYGADRVWIVNVGDLKPMEFPIEFFLTMARTPQRWGKDDLDAYTIAWATREFGPEHAREIAQLVELYTQYNSRRKPEQIEPSTYSLVSGHEADRIAAAWKALAEKADRIAALLPANERASFFELVQYPVAACANLGQMYIAAGRNHLYAQQGRASTNKWAVIVYKRFQLDATLAQTYNSLLDGRWNHMMDQTHIGYTSWSDPKTNVMPALQTLTIPATRKLGIFPEGQRTDCRSAGTCILPPFDSVNRQQRTIELAPLGSEPVPVTLGASAPWIHLSQQSGTITDDTSITVSIDWEHLPPLPSGATIRVAPEGQQTIELRVQLQAIPANARGFVENSGVVTIDAEHAIRNEPAGGVRWETLPGFGLTRSGIETFPVTSPSTLPGSRQACLDYEFTTLTAGPRTLDAILAPTLPFQPGHGLRYSVQLDGQAFQLVDAWKQYGWPEWARAVSDGVHRVTSPLGTLSAGPHTLRICRVDAGIVLERLLIYGATPPAEYLGPEESARILSSVAHAH